MKSVIFSFLSGCCLHDIKGVNNKNKIKKFRHRVLFKLFKEFALRFTFDTCSQLTQEKSKLTPIKYVITPLELEQTISEKVAELYKGEYYDREPVQN